METPTFTSLHLVIGGITQQRTQVTWVLPYISKETWKGLWLVLSKKATNHLRSTVNCCSIQACNPQNPYQIIKNLHGHTDICLNFKKIQLISPCTKMVHYGLDGPGFNCWQGQEMILFSKMSRPALEPIQPPTHWVINGGYFSGIKAAVV